MASTLLFFVHLKHRVLPRHKKTKTPNLNLGLVSFLHYLIENNCLNLFDRARHGHGAWSWTRKPAIDIAQD